MNRRFTAGIIGVGRIGFTLQFDRKREQPASHALALHKNSHIELICAADVDHAQLDLFASRYKQSRTYTDAKTMLDEESPDIVVVAVNEEEHCRMAELAIESGPALVILEKPVAPTLSQARQIARKAAEYHVPVCINHERRFSRDYQMVRRILENGEIGTLHTINARLWSGLHVWGPDCAVKGDCSLIHDGTHLIDTMSYLLQDRQLPKPVLDNVRKSRKTVSQLNWHYNVKDGPVCFVEVVGDKTFFGFELECIADRGRVVIGNGYLKVTRAKPSPYYSNFKSLLPELKYRRPMKTAYFSGMVENCVDHLDGSGQLISSLETGINAVKNLQAVAGLLK
jgi:predicted dehydrogenase